MPTLYHTVYKLPLQSALRAASLTNVAQVVVLLACAFLIDRTGRRNWTVAAFVISAALLAGLAFTGAGSLVAVIVVATLAYGIVGSNAAVLYLYTPEIYPTRMRAIGTGLATLAEPGWHRRSGPRCRPDRRLARRPLGLCDVARCWRRSVPLRPGDDRNTRQETGRHRRLTNRRAEGQPAPMRDAPQSGCRTD